MPLFRGRRTEQLGERTPGRPDGTVGDTGLDFTAWIGVAHQRLVSATTDDDPRCMRVLATEARVAGRTAAEDYAVNERQVEMGKGLIEAANKIFEIAEKIPPLPRGEEHTHTLP